MVRAILRSYRWRVTLGVLVGVAVLGCAAQARFGGAETGVASFYGGQFHGRPTASGEQFDQRAMTAAHRSLAFGTKVEVANLDNGREVVVRINDRGPFVDGRIIDLSAGAAERLGMTRAGLARVRLRVVGDSGLASRGD